VSATATQPLLPDPQAAYDHLFQGVHQRVFFAKLAAAGYDVSTPHSAQRYSTKSTHRNTYQKISFRLFATR
jgi:hypothetical protein